MNAQTVIGPEVRPRAGPDTSKNAPVKPSGAPPSFDDRRTRVRVAAFVTLYILCFFTVVTVAHALLDAPGSAGATITSR